ncbi:TetR/AcrR family transcriptional regulator [Actinomadura sp. ATCC 31491]|uniref:TetR/AcrR family transcriptional regulator n=1 Tax=Actinomadura luzonensis TaxID=2805427 RepID=A0ABT0G772_9ACTN|nr:TetR/AcrR family transcriptional regulator [Actinomadura luzonensis]MCK2220444.1 TetR/AcrR family transcriptional regulator [Actinomadura luzonensis]
MGPTGRRGRPRSEAADARILDAALESLLDRGYDRFSVDEVAMQAGVAKTTLYRRWPTKDHLIVTVVARLQDSVPVEYTGDVRADLTHYLGEIVAGLHRMRQAGRPATSGDASAGLVAEVAAAAARHADVGAAVQAMFHRRNALVLTLLEHAREHGELHADVEPEVLFDQLAGALYYRLLVTGRPIDEAYVDRLVASTLRGASA